MIDESDRKRSAFSENYAHIDEVRMPGVGRPRAVEVYCFVEGARGWRHLCPVFRSPGAVN